MADKSKMSCNKVVASDRAGKKKMVKACEGGKEKLIHFGAKGYGHNYSSAARKSFRARHKCSTAKSKLTVTVPTAPVPATPKTPTLPSASIAIEPTEAVAPVNATSPPQVLDPQGVKELFHPLNATIVDIKQS